MVVISLDKFLNSVLENQVYFTQQMKQEDASFCMIHETPATLSNRSYSTSANEAALLA